MHKFTRQLHFMHTLTHTLSHRLSQLIHPSSLSLMFTVDTQHQQTSHSSLYTVFISQRTRLTILKMPSKTVSTSLYIHNTQHTTQHITSYTHTLSHSHANSSSHHTRNHAKSHAVHADIFRCIVRPLTLRHCEAYTRVLREIQPEFTCSYIYTQSRRTRGSG